MPSPLPDAAQERARRDGCPAVGQDWEYVACVHFGDFILLHIRGIEDHEQRAVVTGDKWAADEGGIYLEGPDVPDFAPVLLIGEPAALAEFHRRAELLLLAREDPR